MFDTRERWARHLRDLMSLPKVGRTQTGLRNEMIRNARRMIALKVREDLLRQHPGATQAGAFFTEPTFLDSLETWESYLSYLMELPRGNPLRGAMIRDARRMIAQKKGRHRD